MMIGLLCAATVLARDVADRFVERWLSAAVLLGAGLALACLVYGGIGRLLRYTDYRGALRRATHLTEIVGQALHLDVHDRRWVLLGGMVRAEVDRRTGPVDSHIAVR